MHATRRRLRRASCPPLDLDPSDFIRPTDLITMRCEDCGSAQVLPLFEVDVLMRAFPDGAGVCPCSS